MVHCLELSPPLQFLRPCLGAPPKGTNCKLKYNLWAPRSGRSVRVFGTLVSLFSLRGAALIGPRVATEPLLYSVIDSVNRDFPNKSPALSGLFYVNYYGPYLAPP